MWSKDHLLAVASDRLVSTASAAGSDAAAVVLCCSKLLRNERLLNAFAALGLTGACIPIGSLGWHSDSSDVFSCVKMNCCY